VTIIVMFWFSRRDCHSTIFDNVSKVISLVELHFNDQLFKPILASSLCFTRTYWITILCMTFKVVYVLAISSAIYSLMSKIIACIT
jgi:hypothetical protein